MAEILKRDCSETIARRYKLRVQGIRVMDLAEREGVTPKAITESICRAKRAFRANGRNIGGPNNPCEVCGKAEILVWNGEHGHVCGRCYFILRRVKLEIEARNVPEEKDMFLELINIH
jgi:hypothetical protein